MRDLSPEELKHFNELVRTAGPLGSRELVLALELARPHVRGRKLALLEMALKGARHLLNEYPSDMLPRDMPPGVGLFAVVIAFMCFEATEGVAIPGRFTP